MSGMVKAMINGGQMFTEDMAVVTELPYVDDAPTKEQYNELVKNFNELVRQLKFNNVIKV